MKNRISDLYSDLRPYIEGLIDNRLSGYRPTTIQLQPTSVVIPPLNIVTGHLLTGGGDLSLGTITLAVDTSKLYLEQGRLIKGGVGELKLTAGSNIIVDAPTNGTMALGAATIGSSSINNYSTAQHTHAIDASNNPGAAEKILKTTPSGGITLASGTITGALVVNQNLTVGANVLFVNQGGSRVGINCAPDSQFQLDVNGNIRASGYIVGKHALQLEDALLIAHYDGGKPNDLNGDTAGHRGQTATYTNKPNFLPGKFGKCLDSGYANANWIPNGDFESSTVGATPSGWAVYTPSGTAPTCTATSETAMVGSKCMLVNTAASPGGSCVYYSATTSTASKTFALWAKAKTSGAQIKIGTDEGNTAWIPLSTTSWKKVTLTVTTAGAFRWWTINTQVGAVYVDLVTLQDGNIPQSWNGSTSTYKGASALTYNAAGNLTGQSGTVSLWMYSEAPNNANYPWQVVFNYGAHSVGGTNQWISAYWSTNAGAPLFRFGYANGNGGVGLFDTNFATAFNAIGWHHYTFTWDGTNGTQVFLKVYIDGALAGSTTLAFAPFTAPTGYSTFSFGGAYFLLDDLVILDSVADADLVKAVYDSNAPIFAETSSFGFKTANNLAWADEQGLWAIDTGGNATFGVSGVDGKSWGGVTLDTGDVLMGRSTSYAKWDNSASAFVVKGEIQADSGSINGILTIGTSGEIRQGSGTWGSNFTGTRLWQTSNVGQIGGYKNSVLQWYSDSNGNMVAGAGGVTLNAAGLTFGQGAGGIDTTKTINFAGSNSSGGVIGSQLAGTESTLFINAFAPTVGGGTGVISMYAPGAFKLNSQTFEVTNSGKVVITGAQPFALIGAANAFKKLYLHGSIANSSSKTWTDYSYNKGAYIVMVATRNGDATNIGVYSGFFIKNQTQTVSFGGNTLSVGLNASGQVWVGTSGSPADTYNFAVESFGY